MKKVTDFLKTCGIGFYVTSAAIVTSIVCLILFGVGLGQGYQSWGSFVCLLVLILADVALVAFKKEAFAPAVSTILSALAIGFFIYVSYNYVAIVTTGIDIESFNTDWIMSVVFYVLTYGLSVASIFVPWTKKNKQALESKEGE